jgi:ATP-dependent DNA helicase RecQ
VFQNSATNANKTPIWNDTIKGDKDRNYYPAKDFFENIIPHKFGEYCFVQSLIISEVEINKTDDVTRVSDITRDNYLTGQGIKTIRISTTELRNGNYSETVTQMLEHLSRYDKLLIFHKNACEKIEENQMSETEIKTK